MSRNDLEKHLRKHGCEFLREGGRHAIWVNPQTLRTAPIPRHTEVETHTARGICDDLGIERPKGR